MGFCNKYDNEERKAEQGPTGAIDELKQLLEAKIWGKSAIWGNKSRRLEQQVRSLGKNRGPEQDRASGWRPQKRPTGAWEQAFRAAESSLEQTGGGLMPSRSQLLAGRSRSLANQASQVKGQGKGIADQGGLGGVGQAEPGGAFETAALLAGIAAFGITLATDAQFPGRRADLEIPGQADTAIRQAQANGEAVAQGALWIGELAGLARQGLWRGSLRQGDIGIRLADTFLAADPLGSAVLVVVAVGKHLVAQRAERIAVLVIAAFETGEGIVVAMHRQQTDGTQGLQLVMDVAQDRFVAFTGVAQEFPDLEIGEAVAQALEPGDGEQVVIDIGRSAGPGQGPELEEAIIDNTKGLGFVAEVVFAGWPGGLLRSGIRVGTGPVGARVVDIGGLGIAWGGETAVLPARVAVTGTALLALVLGRTRPPGGGQAADWSLVNTALVRASLDQLAVAGQAHAPFRRVAREGGLAGDQAVGHQAQDQAGLAVCQPIQLGVGQRHPKSGRAGQIGWIETQPAAVAPAAFGGAQFLYQSFPVPALVDGQKSGQPQAHRIKGGWAKLALEALGEVGPPGREVEQAQGEVEFVQSVQLGAAEQVWGGLPAVVRATPAPGPGRGIARSR